MDGEVGHDGKGGAIEEEEGALQGQKVHVWPEAATLRGSGLFINEMDKDWDTDWKKAFAFDPVLSRKDRRPIEERPEELDKVLFRIIR